MRDLLSWANEIEREMMSEKPVRDVNSVDLVRTRHEQLRAEIEARQDTFLTVIQMGEAMIENDHYAKEEVSCLCESESFSILCEPDRSKLSTSIRIEF